MAKPAITISIVPNRYYNMFCYNQVQILYVIDHIKRTSIQYTSYSRRMNIILDTREHDLYEKLLACSAASTTSLPINIIKETLPLGDVILRRRREGAADATEDVVLIERKSIPDLLASIKDGRYKEQSFRLSNSTEFAHHNVIYIIEGIIQHQPSYIKKQIYGAITSLNYFKGFSVLRTSSVIETAELLLHMAEKIEKELSTVGGKRPAAAVAASATTEEPAPAATAAEEYTAVVKKVKKENITAENIHSIMLSQIPGLSGNTATQIMREFGSIPSLIDRLRENPDCLRDIKVASSSSASAPRKINKPVIENIKLYLLGSSVSKEAVGVADAAT